MAIFEITRVEDGEVFHVEDMEEGVLMERIVDQEGKRWKMDAERDLFWRGHVTTNRGEMENAVDIADFDGSAERYVQEYDLVDEVEREPLPREFREGR